jgi:hypothetical protein
MSQPHLSIDVSEAFRLAGSLESVLKAYYRVWSHEDTKDIFIRDDQRRRFNEIILWSIDCRNLSSDVSHAFHEIEELLKKGVTDTKRQGSVKWYTLTDVSLKYYLDDISYRLKSLWDKLAQIVRIYFLNSKKNVTFGYDKFQKENIPQLGNLLKNAYSSQTYKKLNLYRNDFTHNITQGLANMHNLSGEFWHMGDLICLLLDSYKQIVETYEIVFKAIAKDVASTDVTDFQEMLNRTP